MSLSSLLRPWRGPAFRHIPYGSPYDVLDFRFASLAATNRWNYAGEATMYLASDSGVALAEFARHLKMNRPEGIAPLTIKRSLYRLQVSLEHVLDLRDDACVAALSLSDAPNCFLNRNVARATANFVRATTDAQAILVPSVALLDHPDRWVMVVFLEKLSPDPKQFLLSAVEAGTFQVSV